MRGPLGARSVAVAWERLREAFCCFACAARRGKDALMVSLGALLGVGFCGLLRRAVMIRDGKGA